MVQKVGIEKFVAPVKENEFLADVKELLEAGEGNAITFIVTGAEENTTTVKFGQAANQLGKTARCTREVIEEPTVTMVDTKTGKKRRQFEGGQIKLSFILVDQHKRGKAADKPTEAVEVVKEASPSKGKASK